MSQIIHNKTPGVSDLTPKELELFQDVAHCNEKPVAIRVTYFEMAGLTFIKCDPEEYNQVLLEKLREAGCPAVERGPKGWRLSRGKLTKVKHGVLSPRSDEVRYLWLPDAYVRSMAKVGGIGTKNEEPAHLLLEAS